MQNDDFGLKKWCRTTLWRRKKEETSRERL